MDHTADGVSSDGVSSDYVSSDGVSSDDVSSDGVSSGIVCIIGGIFNRVWTVQNYPHC